MIFFFGKKKRAKGMKEEYYDRLYEIFEWSEKLKKEIHSMERELNELRGELLTARRRGDKERAALIEEEIVELSTRIRKLKSLLKVIESEKRRLEREGNYASAVSALKRIDEAMRINLSIMSSALRPHAEQVLDRLERTLIFAKSERLPEPDSEALMRTYTGKVETQEVPKPEPQLQPVMLVDGMIAKYSFEELVDKVYKVIELYVKYGKKDKLSVKRIAQHVGAGEAEVWRALEILEKQGKIKIRRSKL